MIQVKICGLRSEAEIATAAAGGARWVGLVRFAKSPRHVDLDRLAALAAAARSGGLSPVAVVVDGADAEFAALAPHVDVLQLHGGETATRVAAIRQDWPGALWKAVSVGAAADLAQAADYAPHVDGFVFDARPPKGSDLPGGNGVAFDASLMQSQSIARPWLLSGGLTADTLATAVRRSGAQAVDVSSGVETAPGVKSTAKITEFLDRARRLAPVIEDRSLA